MVSFFAGFVSVDLWLKHKAVVYAFWSISLHACNSSLKGARELLLCIVHFLIASLFAHLGCKLYSLWVVHLFQHS